MRVCLYDLWCCGRTEEPCPLSTEGPTLLFPDSEIEGEMGPRKEESHLEMSKVLGQPRKIPETLLKASTNSIRF